MPMLRPSRYALRSGVIAAALAALLPFRAALAQDAGLYFPASGHTLHDGNGFLTFWREHDGARLLGFPVSEELGGDQPAQYFERGRLELATDPATGERRVRTGAVGSEYAQALWRSFPPPPPRAPAPGEQVFPNGHTLNAPFLGFWQAAGGTAFFGAPISEPLWEMTERGQRQVQYFERARLERDPARAGTPDEIVPGPVGRALALLRRVPIGPVPNPGLESYGPPAPLPPDTGIPQPAALAPASPAPAPAAQPRPAAAPAPAVRPAQRRALGGAKSILVDLRKQWMYAFEGDQQVFAAPVTTGRDGMQTPTGTYPIYYKTRLQTMRGVLDGVPWVVPDVPHVMYINGGVALHGTYWHRLFGSGVRVSHGCINLPLGAAAWLYEWAPVGTPVTVTY
jgi:lipoprotein-anchoring transpeptidase ErfK/SrfK